MLRRALVLLIVFTFGLVGGALLFQRSHPDRSGEGNADALEVTSILLAAMEHGPARALARLDSIVRQEPSLAAGGHDIAHAIGKIAVAGRDNASEVLAECTPGFQSGCYHGAVQRYFATRGTISPDRIRSICDPLREAGASELIRLECAHGVGHGLNALLEHDLVATLESCDALAADAASWCHDGAFMQNLTNAAAEMTRGRAEESAHGHEARHSPGGERQLAASHTEHIRRNDLHYPCNAVAPRYRAECWKYQPIVALMLSSNDLAVAASLCSELPPELSAACLRGFGTYAAGINPGQPVDAARTCGIPEVVDANACLAGAADYYFAVHFETRDAFAVCARIPGDAGNDCFARIGDRIALAHADTSARAAACRAAGAAGETPCRVAARLQPRD